MHRLDFRSVIISESQDCPMTAVDSARWSPQDHDDPEGLSDRDLSRVQVVIGRE